MEHDKDRMTDQPEQIIERLVASQAVMFDARFRFTVPFLCGAALMSRLAFEIEHANPDDISEESRTAHRSYVVGAIMQATAALETEIWDFAVYGPGHHLGSDQIDQRAKAFLSPLVELIDGQDTMSRFETVLHLLGKPSLPRGQQPWQDAELVIRLRNELVHYKSRWGEELAGQKLFKALHQKKLPRPPFVSACGANFFPHQCLSASYAAWAVESCAAFLDAFYALCGFVSPLEEQRQRLVTRPVHPHPNNESAL
jgi:hypothetical protein